MVLSGMVALFKVWKVPQYLLFGHSGCQIGSDIIDGKPKAAYARLAAYFAGFNSDARIQVAITLEELLDLQSRQSGAVPLGDVLLNLVQLRPQQA